MDDRHAGRHYGGCLQSTGGTMKIKLATVCFVLGAAVAPVAFAADSDTDRNKPGTFVKDSAITTKVKTKLAADSPSSMATIHVDTDKDGVVWMSGTAKSQQEIDKAVSIAKGTEGVKSVKNELKIKP
jgi:hyperosmotically inducible protein